MDVIPFQLWKLKDIRNVIITIGFCKKIVDNENHYEIGRNTQKIFGIFQSPRTLGDELGIMNLE